MLVHLEIQAMLPGHLFPVWENVREHLKRTYFELQLQLQGREDMALINAGILSADLGNLDEAVAFFDRVLEKAPNHPGACFTKGLAYYQMGKFKEAIELFDRALEAAPNFQEAQQARRMAAIALSGKEEE
ncbi:MAG TPA: tetratricopeptide repeat protein [Thermosulfidibacter takaii]|uniref:Tetratricopeptide repeat protein n=1 Tax=Thermosulfidibacter takaii TaxID=412593 RepID=A0A7C0YDG5_9BACT|nr:tetratricopeptide repeat protein [Thermosulfidibacter takaii]